MVHSTNISAISSDTTLSNVYDTYLVDASAGNILITLPLITSDGINYFIIRTDNVATNTVTMQTSGGQTLNGSTSIYPNASMHYQSYNNAWYSPTLYGTSSGGTVIPYASGTPTSVTTIAGGLIGTVAALGFGGNLTGISLTGVNIDASTINNYAFSVPRDGFINTINCTFSITAGLTLTLSTVTLQCQLYSSSATGNTFAPVVGTDVTINPPLTGAVAIGTVISASSNVLSVPITRGSRLLFQRRLRALV